MINTRVRLLPPAAAPPAPKREAEPSVDESVAPPVQAISQTSPTYQTAPFNGEKFSGGYGPTEFLWPDYWTLRARSAQLYRKNLYARGIIRRLVTNEINTGLHLEATPEASVLGIDEDTLADWAESVETLFSIWGREPRLCDYSERLTFGEIEELARLEALVSGDVLVMRRVDQRTGLPRIQLISGSRVQTPMQKLVTKPGENRVVHGVELDANGRQVAYWVLQEDGTSKRLLARGPKSGRRIAWMIYGTDKRLDAVRGEPILSIILQSLAEVDRYRDATTRKAVLNSFLAMFVKKEQPTPGTLPLAHGATLVETATTTDSSGNERQFTAQEYLPGMMINELAVGETPQAFKADGTDEKFGNFEAAMVQGIAWALEIPPEILRLSFGTNYAASQAAINEFKLYLNKSRTTFGLQFCQPFYSDWLVSMVLQQRIEAPGLLSSWRSISQWETFGAWVSSEWSGQIKPAVDMLKLAKAYREQVDLGFITRGRATREVSGMKHSKVVKQLKRENEKLAEANAPLETTGETVAAAPAEGEDDELDENGRTQEEREEEEAAAIHVVTGRAS
jgi:lambda family phage portal protein